MGNKKHELYGLKNDTILVKRGKYYSASESSLSGIAPICKEGTNFSEASKLCITEVNICHRF